MLEDILPPLPQISDALRERAKASGSNIEIFFEWSRYVSILCIKLISIDPNSPAVIERPEIQYAILRGLINRCCRILLAMLKISSENKHGEIVLLLSRCLFESCVKARWLIVKNDPNMFLRYVSDGLKAEFDLKKIINQKTEERGDGGSIIEQRMLSSIQKTFSLCPYSEEELRSAKKMPDFASMCRDLGYDNLGYVALQRIGSHAVHGTWVDLLFHYLEHDEEGFGLRDNVVPPGDDNFAFGVLLMLGTMREYTNFLLFDEFPKDEIVTHIQEVERQILEDLYQVRNSDFNFSDHVQS